MDDLVENESNVVRDVEANRQHENDTGGMEMYKKLVWEYELSRGRWIKYENAISRKLNENIADGVTEFEMDESKLQVDFNSMKQKNLDTGFVRSVRCTIQNDEGIYRVWEYIDSKRRWRSVDPTSAVTLESAFAIGSGNAKIVLSGTNFMADFDDNSIRSDDGLTEYKIRSHISDAEPSMSAKPVPRVDRLRAIKRIAERPNISLSLDESKRKALTEEDDRSDTNGDDDNNEKQISELTRTSRKGNGTSRSQKTNESNSVGKDDRSKLKKVIVKGVAAVDPECHELVGSAHVYTESNNVYDALLNQTNAQYNNNKYFIIQLLESDIEKRYWVWFRWGRVGYKGQTSLNSCGIDLAGAKELFCDKFKSKTENNWAERTSFKKVIGKYDYLPTDYSKVIEEKKNENDAEEIKGVESKLNPHLQHLLNIICDIRAMEETMTELEYDVTKAPLGKVTDEQIKEGYAALTKIEEHIKKKDFSSSFIETVNNYYTKIPHFFGMRPPPIIKTLKQLKIEIKLLEALSEIEVAVRTFKKEGNISLHPFDRYYMNMKCEISLLNANDPNYKVFLFNENDRFDLFLSVFHADIAQIVDNYLQWTHAPTHNMYHLRIRNLYAVNRDGERKQFMFDIGNRKLLWHGSRLTNWYSILSQGLRIAPPEAPVTGYMFGKGIYFADMSTKSANYCYPQPNKPGFLVLAQVALGDMNELLQADFHADRLPAGKNSTKGLGSIGPDPATYVTLDDCEVLCGKPITLQLKDKDSSLMYNEYIVYDVKQVWIRYLIEVDFIFD
uniref:Poly [ADP-ribose] polymerase n=1 Tax=Elaeophora elaphi TaxID=1147741 RepID=A0A0R3RG07_9BILA